jgi:prepilin-type N-terminal cleavage/methylation domain-containing protein
MKNHSSEKGFTLLELILSLSIVGVILALALGGIRLGTITREIGDDKAEIHQRLRTIAQQLGQKIKSNYPVYIQSEKRTFLNEEANKNITRQLAFQGGKNFIRMVTFAPPLSGDPEKTYHAHETLIYQGELPESKETGIILMEREIRGDNLFTYIRPEESDSHFFMLAKNVAYLKFRYYQMELIPKNEQESQPNPDITHRGIWIEEVFAEGIGNVTEEEKERDERLGITASTKISLPRAVEISLGLKDTRQKEDKKDDVELVYAPPIIIPLNSGIEFALPLPKEETDEKA